MARLLGIHEPVESIISLKSDKPYFNNERLYWVINPNASDLRVERRWPAQSFIQLIQRLLNQFEDIDLILIGGPGEAAHVEQIAGNFQSDRLINLAGQTSIDELIQILSFAELVITNDSGPMHLASACGRPVIGLFGPCHPSQYGDLSNIYPIYKSVYCSPCVHEFSTPPCGGNNQCMQLIEVEEVLFAIEEVRKGWKKNADSRIIYRPNNPGETLGLVKR